MDNFVARNLRVGWNNFGIKFVASLVHSCFLLIEGDELLQFFDRLSLLHFLIFLNFLSVFDWFVFGEFLLTDCICLWELRRPPVGRREVVNPGGLAVVEEFEGDPGADGRVVGHGPAVEVVGGGQPDGVDGGPVPPPCGEGHLEGVLHAPRLKRLGFSGVSA